MQSQKINIVFLVVIGVLLAVIIVLMFVLRQPKQIDEMSITASQAVEDVSQPEEKNVVTGTVSEDGTHDGIIKSIKKIDGKSYLEIDYIEVYGGAEGMRLAQEDGVCDNRDSCAVYQPRYIRNNNPKIRTFEIDPNVVLQFNNDETYTLDQFYSSTSIQNKFQKGSIGRIEIKNSKLIKLFTTNAG